MGTDEKGRGGKDAAALSGGHLCHVCGYQYPNPNPSAKLRRSHRKHCGNAPAVAVAAEGNAALEGNTDEGALLGGGAGGGRREEIVGAKSQANGGAAASRGSAGGVDASVEGKVIAEHASPTDTRAQATVTELSENNHLINCGNSESASPEDIGTQIITSELSENGLADGINNSIEIKNGGNGIESQIACIEEGQTKVGHPAEREDSFDDFQDASPFLHQSDFEDGAAPSSVFPTEINNLNTFSSGSSVTANEISLETNGLCNDQLSGESNMRNLSAGPQVGYNVEDGALRLVEPELNLKLDPYDHSVDVDNTYTDMVNSKSDKTSGCCEPIDDSNASSLQETPPIILEPELGKVEGFVEDIMHVLHRMPEGSPRPVVGADNIQLERIADPVTNAVPIGSDLMKVVCTDNTPTDCSTKLPTQNLTVEDISDDHQHAENSCNKSLECSTAGFQYDLSVTNVDDIPVTNVDDLKFTFDERPEVEPDASEEKPSVQTTNGFTEEEVCNKHIDVEIPTEDQFSMSQKHATLLMDQASSAKNPFNLDDDRNDDLFELSADSCYLEVPNAVVESRQQVDSKSLLPTVSNQTRMAEVQQWHNSDERILPASNASGNGEVVVSPEDMPISSSSELVNKTCLSDHGLKEDEVHTGGIIFVPSQVASSELSMVSTQDISALGEEVEETTQTEDATPKEMTAVRSIGGIEMKQAIDTTAKDTYAAIEDMKLTEGTAAGMNEVQHIDCVEAQMQAGSTKDVSAVQSIEDLEENKQAEDADVKETNSWFNPNDVEDKTETTKEMIAAESTESVEEKQQPKGIVGQDGSNNKQNEEIAATGARLNPRRVRVPLKVLLAEASAENQVKKPSTKERVLSFGRRVSKDGNSATGSDDHNWSSPAKLPRKDVDKSSRGRKQPWMPFICCHSVH